VFEHRLARNRVSSYFPNTTRFQDGPVVPNVDIIIVVVALLVMVVMMVVVLMLVMTMRGMCLRVSAIATGSFEGRRRRYFSQ